MRVLLATAAVAVAAGSISPASAADLRQPALVTKAPPVVAVFNWTGCYVGGHVGWGWGDKSWTFLPPSPAAGRDAGSHDVDGWLGGGQVGCDFQFGNLVIGAEGSYSWAGIDGSHTGNAAQPLLNVVEHSEIKSIGTATGRLGFASNNWLFYGKGGGAWVRDQFTVTNAPSGGPFDERQTRSGWLVGGGIEYAFAPNWSAKVEYNFIDLGNKTVFARTPAPTDIDQQVHTIKFGLNFRFGGYGGY